VKYQIVELDGFSGEQTTIYTIKIDGESDSVFDKFLQENKGSHKKELIEILKRLKIIGHEEGARGQYFKHHEGTPGDLVCALYDEEESKLRLYCVRYGSIVLIVGSGGQKPKEIKSWQQDKKLTEAVELMKKISADIERRRREKELWWSADGTKLEGDLNYDNYED